MDVRQPWGKRVGPVPQDAITAPITGLVIRFWRHKKVRAARSIPFLPAFRMWRQNHTKMGKRGCSTLAHPKCNLVRKLIGNNEKPQHPLFFRTVRKFGSAEAKVGNPAHLFGMVSLGWKFLSAETPALVDYMYSGLTTRAGNIGCLRIHCGSQHLFLQP